MQRPTLKEQHSPTSEEEVGLPPRQRRGQSHCNQPEARSYSRLMHRLVDTAGPNAPARLMVNVIVNTAAETGTT